MTISKPYVAMFAVMWLLTLGVAYNAGYSSGYAAAIDWAIAFLKRPLK